MQVNDPVAPKNINRASCASSNHAPPAEGEQRLERHDGSAIYSPLTLLYKRKKKKNQSRASSFSRRKVQRNAWSSEKTGGYEIFRLGGKPAASFHFKRLSIRRCHLWRRRRTLERISDGAVMWEKRVTCSADALSWFLTSTSAPPASVQLDISTFPPPAYWRGL